MIGRVRNWLAQLVLGLSRLERVTPEVPLYPSECDLVHTPELGALFGALAQAQGGFKNPEQRCEARIDGLSKKGEPIRYTYTYAALADVLDAARAPMSAAGLAVIQGVSYTEGRARVTTLLGHGSGQWIRSEVAFAAGGAIKDAGAIFTYLRRYSVSALLGLASERDTDGESEVRKREGREGRERDRRRTGNPVREEMAARGVPADPPKDPAARFQGWLKEFWIVALDRFPTRDAGREWLREREAKPDQASPERLHQILVEARALPEHPEVRRGLATRWNELTLQLGLEEVRHAWAEQTHKWPICPQRGLASPAVAPLPRLRDAIADLEKMSPDQAAAIVKRFSKRGGQDG